jgi:glycine cleavage system aminomethyltransferase T
MLVNGVPPDFGQESLPGELAQRHDGVQRHLVRLVVSGNDCFDARGQEPLRVRAGAIVGRTTSGGYGHCLGESLAMGYLSSQAMKTDGELESKLMNEWLPTSVRLAED